MELCSSCYAPHVSEYLSVRSPVRLHRASKSVPMLFENVVMEL
jgi:hypothetical protein